jgi:hypothetical protein
MSTGYARAGEEEVKPPLGSGQRFAALKSKLGRREGVKNPGALAAYIGRKKYGNAKMAAMSAKGRRAAHNTPGNGTGLDARRIPTRNATDFWKE